MRNIQQERDYIAFYKRRGICTCCKKYPARPGKAMCEVCALDSTERAAKWRKENPERYDEIRKRNNERWKKIKKERKEAGLCLQCGRKVNDSRYVCCIECRLKSRRRAKKILREKEKREG